MLTITCTRSELKERVSALLVDISEPLYRGLSELAERDYHQEGVLLPYEGSLAVGNGVCFSNSVERALGYCKRKIILTSREKLDPRREAVDTRVVGYEHHAEKRLLQHQTKFTGYELWEEVIKDDTIVKISPRDEDYVFVRRTPVTQDEIIAEIEIIN